MTWIAFVVLVVLLPIALNAQHLLTTIKNKGVCFLNEADTNGALSSTVWCSPLALPFAMQASQRPLPAESVETVTLSTSIQATHLSAETFGVCAFDKTTGRVTCWLTAKTSFYSGWPNGTFAGPYLDHSSGIAGWCGIVASGAGPAGSTKPSCAWATGLPLVTRNRMDGVTQVVDIAANQRVCVGSSYACTTSNQGRRLQCYGDLVAGFPSLLEMNASADATIQQAACGNNILCVLFSNTTIRCWPDNNVLPIGVPSLTRGWSFVTSAPDMDRVCAIKTHSHETVCWTKVFAPGEIIKSPVNSFTGDPIRMSQVSTSAGITCGSAIDDLENSGKSRIRCWGTPAMIAAADSSALQLASDLLVVGTSHACAETECWGDFSALVSPWPSRSFVSPNPLVSAVKGQTKIIGGAAAAAETLIGTAKIVKMAAGTSFTCAAIEATNNPFAISLTCWGSAASPATVPAIPQSVLASTAPRKIQTMVAGSAFVCIHWSFPNSSVECWGTMVLQPGSPAWPTASYPHKTVNFKSISASSFSVCGIVNATGAIVCWGGGIFREQSPPVDVTAWDMVALTLGSGCGLPSGGTGALRCWGDRPVIALPLPNLLATSGSFGIPRQLVGAQGAYCALFSKNGTVACWGSSVPASIPSVWPGTFSTIAAGNSAAVCGIRRLSRQVVCFGSVTTQPSFVSNVPRRALFLQSTREASSCLPGHYAAIVNADATGICSGPCAAGQFAASNRSFVYDTSACFKTCTTGHFCKEATVTPIPCPAGVFGAQPGLSDASCTQPCPVGFYCQEGSVLPTKTPCPPGRFGNQSGLASSTCSGECDPGWWCPQGSSTPRAIPCQGQQSHCPRGSGLPNPTDPGFYSSISQAQFGGGFDTQTACEIGFACQGGFRIACTDGQFSNATGQTACQTCQPGSFGPRSTANAKCTSCATGTYNQLPRQTSCIACSSGKYQSSVGSADCTSCAPGSFANATGQTACGLCDKGRFQPLSGALDCVPCSTGAFGGTLGLTSCKSCEPGFFQDALQSDGCKPCRDQTYSSLPGSIKCLDCTGTAARRVTVAKNATACETLSCPAGYQLKRDSISIATLQCQACGVGRYALAGNTGDCIECPIDTYSLRNASSQCLPCPRKSGVRCVSGFALSEPGYWVFVHNDSTTIDVLPCAGGESVCPGQTLSQFLSTGESQCGPNRKPDSVLCGECIDGFSEWNGQCADCRNTSTSGGMIFFLIAIATLYTIGLHVLSQSSPSSMSIFFNFVQVSLLMIGNTNILSWLGPINFGVNRSAGPVCVSEWDAYDRLYTGIFTPLALLAILAVVAGTQQLLFKRCQRCLGACRLAGKVNRVNPYVYLRTVINMTILSYTNITSTTLQFMQCLDLGPGEPRIVFTEPSIDCSTAKYKSVLGFVATIFVADPLLLPVIICVFLVRNRERIKDHQAQKSGDGGGDGDNTKTAPDAKDQDLQDIQLDDVEAPAKRSRRGATIDNTHNLFSVSLSILFESFKYNGYFWQVVLLSRRTILVILHTFLFQYPSSKYVAMSIVNLVAFLAHGIFMPYRKLQYNRIELISLLLLLIQSMILTGDPPPSIGSPTLSAVTTLIIAPIVAFVLFKLYEARGN